MLVKVINRKDGWIRGLHFGELSTELEYCSYQHTFNYQQTQYSCLYPEDMLREKREIVNCKWQIANGRVINNQSLCGKRRKSGSIYIKDISGNINILIGRC